MALELVYTSVPKGLKPGTYGFCTVACSKKLSEKTILTLEKLSGYRRVTSDPAGANPVVYSHLFVEDGVTTQRVLSRVSAAGIDYSGRANKIACHFVLDTYDLNAAGPARTCAEEKLFVEEWDKEPKYFENEFRLPSPSGEPLSCAEWKELTGDAGWAGALASTAFSNQPVLLIVNPTHNVLRLYEEAIDLLPPYKRWDVTFSTYYTKLPPGIRCQWKAVLQGSPEVSALRALGKSLVIDLTNPSQLSLEDAAAAMPYAAQLVELARSDRAQATPDPDADSPFALSDDSEASQEDESALPAPPLPTIKYVDDPSLVAPPPAAPPPITPPPVILPPSARRTKARKEDASPDEKSPRTPTPPAVRFVFWLALGALAASAAALVVMKSLGYGPFAPPMIASNLTTPSEEEPKFIDDESTHDAPVSDDLTPDEPFSDDPSGDDGIGEDLPGLFEEDEEDEEEETESDADDTSEELEADDVEELQEEEPVDEDAEIDEQPVDEDSFFPKEWIQEVLEGSNDDEQDPAGLDLYEGMPYVDPLEFQPITDVIKALNEGSARVDFNIASGGNPTLRYDLTGLARSSMQQAYRFCKERGGKIAVTCSLELDVNNAWNFENAANSRVQTQEIDFSEEVSGESPRSLQFNVVSEKDPEIVESLELQFSEVQDYDGLLTFKASSATARSYFLSAAKLKWTFIVPPENGDPSLRFESENIQLLRPWNYMRDAKVVLTPYYELSATLGEGQPSIVNEESLTSERKKYALVILHDGNGESHIKSDMKSRMVDFNYSFQTPYLDQIEFMTIRFAKSKNARQLEFTKFFDKEELEIELDNYYSTRIQNYIERRSREQGEWLTLANPNEVAREIEKNIQLDLENATALRDEPHQFSLYLAPTTEQVYDSARNNWALLGVINITRATTPTPNSKKRY